jgi:ribosomal protein S18 acetylase RimI-like enzyme
MSLATWWSNDPLPELALLSAFVVQVANDATELARVTKLSVTEVEARWDDGHRAYVGYLHGQPATYGWLATRRASIGEVNLDFTLPFGERYLWDFATLPDWQGRGLYPRLLQAIVADVSNEARRLWIIHAPENLPSGAGMHKAGFEPVGQLSFRAEGGVGLMPSSSLNRAQVGSELLGVPLIDTVLAPCWTCGGVAQIQDVVAKAENCWPPLKPSQPQCNCATPVKPSLVRQSLVNQASVAI